ncbi:DMT family transporter [Pseudohalocynthiibacter aestuariivivens]|uniref:DMT family transporter n=1 Tax=Roseovarius pelagicus TaxID=2980108 RepID=A0ABY6DHT9_9RHOB|nr:MULTISPECIES: DMT family transporter [Rhodobacterales]QIE46929.1 DMT family transporter [Pseudohalocynthiibacter aestuariivivens]UXX84523.1 DMT family transporter [Roseovarius pelagicus]
MRDAIQASPLAPVETAGLRARLAPATVGALLAWGAVLIYAASNSIVTLLVGIGAQNTLPGGHNAITYANLLVLGSIISLGPIALLYRRDLTRANLRRLTRRDWRILMLSAVLSSALTPGLFFYALEHTTVTNVVLIGRIEPPLFLLATWLFLKERLNPYALLAGLIALAGAIVIIGAGHEGGFTFGKGEIATIAATLSFIASTLVTRVGLRDVPVGIFSTFRTVIGTAVYVALTLWLRGSAPFQGILSPVLWNWVWLYAGIVIVVGQLVWTLALKHARADDVSLATSFSPLAAIFFAMLLLGEVPGPGLLPGAMIIVLAIVIGQYGRRGEPTPAHPQLFASLPVTPRPAHRIATRQIEFNSDEPTRVDAWPTWRGGTGDAGGAPPTQQVRRARWRRR